MSGPVPDDRGGLYRKISAYRDTAIVVLITLVLVAYIVVISIQVRSVIRNSDEVVLWHGREVRSQDAHRGRLERRFDAVEQVVRENNKILGKLIREPR